MKTISILLINVFILLGCSKNETPPDQPVIPVIPPIVNEPAADSATALITMLRKGQQIMINVYSPAGIKKWTAYNDKNGGLGIRPYYHDKQLYANFGDTLFAYDIESGKMLWRVKHWLFSAATPTAYNGVLFTPSKNTLFELSVADGKLLKKHSIGGLVPLPAFVRDSVVYLFTATDLARYSFKAYNLGTRKFNWSIDIGYNPPIEVSMVGDNFIFKSDFSYYLNAIDINTGNIVWRRDDQRYSQHTIYGDRIFAVPEGGREYLNINAIDARSGSRIWKWIQNKVTSGITDIHLYKDQVNFMIYEPNNKVAYIAVSNTNGDSLWRRNEPLGNLSYRSVFAGDKLYRYERPPDGSQLYKIVIYEAKTFTAIDSSAAIEGSILHMMVIKKSDN